jgi:hypothetical protein
MRRLELSALILTGVGITGCAAGQGENIVDCSTDVKTDSAIYVLPKGQSFRLGGPSSGFGHHAAIEIRSDGNGNFSVVDTTSSDEDHKVIMENGVLKSVTQSLGFEPYDIHSDGTVIFNGSAEDIDFRIKASEGENNRTRFDITAACPTS